MFEPTIKYRRVNDPPKDITKPLDNLTIADAKKQEPPVLETTTPKESATKVVTEEKQAQDSPASTKEVIEDTKLAIDDTKNNQPEPELETTTAVSSPNTVKSEPDYTFEEEEEDYKIAVDPSDKERIIVTLSTGKQFSADRYCPHAGADLSFHGKVSEHDYPPEIGPILMCPIHYWEFALEKGGKGGGGWATINACPVEVAEKCAASAEKKKLDW